MALHSSSSEPLFIAESSKKNGGFQQSLSAHNLCDGMRAASPPRTAEEGDDGDLYGQDAMAAQYRAWVRMHPSALANFDALAEKARGKQVAIFLDYDGTLSPIVEDPNKAFMSEAMREVVKEVACLFPTAIISGRGREKVFDFVKLKELYYAGSHGLDIAGPATRPNGTIHDCNGATSSEVVVFQPAAEFVPIMNEVYERLQERVAGVSGSNIEHNKFCISVHFRRVPEHLWDDLAQTVHDIVKEYPRLKTTHGRKVLEVRPTVEWDKGKALAYLLKALDLESTTDVLPLYIGDDRTDEDAFTVLSERGAGCGILVSTVAKTTEAVYSLRDPSEVMMFLRKLVSWQKSRESACRKEETS